MISTGLQQAQQFLASEIPFTFYHDILVTQNTLLLRVVHFATSKKSSQEYNVPTSQNS
jgi:hypothetical protein